MLKQAIKFVLHRQNICFKMKLEEKFAYTFVAIMNWSILSNYVEARGSKSKLEISYFHFFVHTCSEEIVSFVVIVICLNLSSNQISVLP